MSKVFVSYKRADEDKVFPIVDRMESKLGIKFWVDLEGIDGDRLFTSVIINAINECEVFLFMYSKAHERINDYEYDYTVRELNFAHELRKRIVFIEVEETKLPHWFIFNFPQRQVTYANDSRSMDRLVEDIRRWLRLPQLNPPPSNQGLKTDTVSVPKENSSHPQTESAAAINPHPQAIDLGLPSGTKWASCNVGANKPEEYGSYYAWGETEVKNDYKQENYLYQKSKDSCQDIGCNIACTQYDVAHMKWGGGWQMPSDGDFRELFVNCHHEWLTLKGINGLKITSKINGKSIFLPAAGYRWDDDLNYVSSSGYYWSSSQDPSGSYYAYRLYFNSGYAGWYSSYYRGNGHTIRPVFKS